MVDDNLLNKYDTGQRGKKSVFYSITQEAEKRLKLGILTLQPKHELFKEIFTNLFLRGITEGDSYATANLDELLSDINATRQDLAIDHIERRYSKDDIESEHVNIQEKILSISLATYYKPIYGVHIFESTSYRIKYMKMSSG
jgi:hypothetical protein